MSGHSRWSQVKHKKAITDAKRGQLFSKLVREIMVATRDGGPDPSTNSRLHAALEKARQAGLPKDNAERAVSRASGNNGDQPLQEFLYEVVGPGSVYILVEGITDNSNRTLAEVKQILTKYDAKTVPPGSLLWNFEKAWTEEEKNYKPHTSLEAPPEKRERIKQLLDELMNQDDVQKVYTNLSD